MPLLHRIARNDHAPVVFTLDGVDCEGRAGDTLLTAILCHADKLSDSEFLGAPRAGFCLMGACQDCWVLLASGQRLRACSTELAPGMAVVTRQQRVRR